MWSAPPVALVSWLHSPSPVLRKKHKKQRSKVGPSPESRKDKHGECSSVQPVSGHSFTPTLLVTPSTPSCSQVPLSLVQDHPPTPGGHHGTSRISVLSTLETFAVARDQMALLVLPTLAEQVLAPTRSSSRREHVVLSSYPALSPLVPTRGKLTLLMSAKNLLLQHRSLNPWHWLTEARGSSPLQSLQTDLSSRSEVKSAPNPGANTSTQPMFHQIPVWGPLQAPGLVGSGLCRNPWDFLLVPGVPSSHSYTVVSERRAAPLCHLDSSTEPVPILRAA